MDGSESDAVFKMPVRKAILKNLEDEDVADVFKVPVSSKSSGQQSDGFKKPIPIPTIGKKVKGIVVKKAAQQKELEKEINEVPVNSKEPDSDQSTSEAKEMSSEDVPRIEGFLYKEPEWGHVFPADEEYRLEFIKAGTSRGEEPLDGKSFFIMGRNEEAVDLFTPHPMISRQHAVLQYSDGSKETSFPKGFYVYDLGSTQGTYLNKERLLARKFYRFRVGSIIRLGQTNRLYVLLGPEEEDEGVHVQTSLGPQGETAREQFAREAKEAAVRLMAEKKRLKAEEERKRKEKEEIDRGIDWGMGDDAAPIEDPDEGVNPFAIIDDEGSAKEEPFLNDPRKALKGWFDREGEEANYQVEERKSGHHICRLVLPVDSPGGGTMVAEAEVKGGKKKDAMAQCALEACRILDRMGLLRPAHQKAKAAKKRSWETDDFYDSDEDEFLDRTGEIEKKRKIRMKLSGVAAVDADGGGEKTGMNVSKAETYESLLAKKEDVQSRIADEEAFLKRIRTEKREGGAEEGGAEGRDSLDAFMVVLQKKGEAAKEVAKEDVSRAKRRLAELRLEETRLNQLIKVAAPSKLVLAMKASKPSPMVGKMRGRGTKTVVQQRLPSSTTSTEAEEREFKEEFDEEEDEEEKEKRDGEKEKRDGKEEKGEKEGGRGTKEEGQKKDGGSNSEKRKVPLQRTSVGKSPSSSVKEPETTKIGIESKERPKVVMKVKGPYMPPGLLKALKGEAPLDTESAMTDDTADAAKYSEWIPPEGQKGDGKTDLNRKLGY